MSRGASRGASRGGPGGVLGGSGGPGGHPGKKKVRVQGRFGTDLGANLGGFGGLLGANLGHFLGIVFGIIFEPPPEPVWDPFGAPKVTQNGFQIAPKGFRNAKCGIIKNVEKPMCFWLFSGFQALRRGLRKQLFGDFASKRSFKTKNVPSEARFGAKLAPQTGPKSLPKRSKFKSNFQSKFGTAPEGHLERKKGWDPPTTPTSRGWGSPWRGVGGRFPTL